MVLRATFALATLFLCTIATTFAQECPPPADLPLGLGDTIPGLGKCMASNKLLNQATLMTLLGAEKEKCNLLSVLSLIQNPLIQRGIEASNSTLSLLSFLQTIKNEEVGSLCLVLNGNILPCIEAVLPLIPSFFEDPCCEEVKDFYNPLSSLIVPSDIKNAGGNLVTLIQHLLNDVNQMVCSRSKAADRHYCSYSLLTYSNPVSLIQELFSPSNSIPIRNQCDFLSGKKARVSSSIYDMGECSVSYNRLMERLDSVPALHLFTHINDLPIIGNVKLINPIPVAPCCTFDRKVAFPTEFFGIRTPTADCDRRLVNPDKWQCDSNAASADLLPFVGGLPGVASCMAAPRGLSFKNIVDDFGSSPTCSLSLITSALDEPTLTTLVGEITNILTDDSKPSNAEKVQRLMKYLSSISSERFTNLCGFLNDEALKCASEFIPKVIGRLEDTTNTCCGSMSMIVDLVTLITVPEGVNGGLGGFIEILLGSLNSAMCDVRESDNQTCAYNFAQNINSHLFSVWKIPSGSQCSSFPWNYGACGASVARLIGLFEGIPLINAFADVKLGPDVTVGEFLGAWEDLPCCEASLFPAVNPVANPFNTPLPVPKCQQTSKSKDCKKSTVTPYVLSLDAVGGLSKCFGSGFSMLKVLKTFGRTKSCHSLIYADIVDGKNPAAKAIKDKVGEVLNKMSESHTEGLLDGIGDILASMRVLENSVVSDFCSFLDNNAASCVAETFDQIYQSINDPPCCSGMKSWIDQFYREQLSPSNVKYDSLFALLKGIVNNLQAAICTTHTPNFENTSLSAAANQYCGYTLLKNTLGFDYKKLSPYLDPLTAVGVYSLYPIYQMLTAKPGQACDMLQGRNFVTNTKSCDAWSGMWFKYGCCGASLGTFTETIGSIPLVNHILEDTSINLRPYGLGNFLDGSIELKYLLGGYPDLGCCKDSLGKCDYTGGAAYKVPLPPQTPKTCEKFESTCAV